MKTKEFEFNKIVQLLWNEDKCSVYNKHAYRNLLKCIKHFDKCKYGYAFMYGIHYNGKFWLFQFFN